MVMGLKLWDKIKKIFSRDKISCDQMVFGWGNEKKIKDLRKIRDKYKPIKELKRSSDSKMIICTVTLPEYMIEWLNNKSRNHYFNSRSEAVRFAIRDFIRNEDEFLEFLEKKYGKTIEYNDKEYEVIGEA